VICTVGRCRQPARVTVGKGRLFVSAIGLARVGTVAMFSQIHGTVLNVATGTNETRVRLNGLSWGDVTATRRRGTWVYLGQGYQTGRLNVRESFSHRLRSVQTRVLHSAGIHKGPF
jgi:hypothetical protein